MPAATITTAEYDPDTERITYEMETDDGDVFTDTFTKWLYGPEYELTDEQMETLAGKLPGTPVYDRTDGPPFDMATFPAVGIE